MADNSKPATSGAAESPRKRSDVKNVSVNSRPELRQHQSTFYLNFVTKGIGHEMAQNRRGHEEERATATESFDVNKSKVYSLGQTATNPPYHIHGDGDRVIGAGRFSQIKQNLTAALHREDSNRDGCVTHQELANAILSTADPFMSSEAIHGLWRLLDPKNTGKVAIDLAVGATVRNLTTRPSQRQTVGAGSILAWADDGTCKNPTAREAVRLGGSQQPRVYYGVEAEALAPPAPTREACLPGLMPSIAGLSSGARGDKNSRGQLPSPRQHRGGLLSSSAAAAAAAQSAAAVPALPSSPWTTSPRKRSPPTRTVMLRDQFLKQEQEHQERMNASKGFTPLPATHKSPRSQNVVAAPRPGLYLVSQ